MGYFDFLHAKLGTDNNADLFDLAVRHIGDSYPNPVMGKRGFLIVDEWIEKIMSKWQMTYRILNFSQTNVFGKLEPTKGGFIININKNLFSTQRRFTIAHELAHVISFDVSQEWPVSQIRHSKVEEYFCNRVARNILLPKSLIDFSLFDIENLDRNQVEQIKYLWPEFKVSSWQIVKKLLEDNGSELLVGILWEYFPKEGCLKIIEHHHPKNLFIPKNDRIFLNNLLQEKRKTNLSPELAFNSNDFFQDQDLVEIGSLYKKTLLSTTFPIKTKSSHLVIQIIKLK